MTVRCLVVDPVSSGHHREYISAFLNAAPAEATLRLPTWYRDASGHPSTAEFQLGMDANVEWATHIWLPDGHKAVRQLAIGKRRLQGLKAVAIDMRGLRSVWTFPRPTSWLGDRARGAAETTLHRTALARNRNLKIGYLNPYGLGPVHARTFAFCDLIDPVPDLAAAQAIPPNGSLLVAGHIDERKGLDLLLDAVFQVGPHSWPIRVVGIVAEPYRATFNQLVGLARARGIDITVVSGFVSDMDLWAEIMACQAVLLPYKSHLGNSGLIGKALSVGKVVLVSDYGFLGQVAKNNDCLTFRNLDSVDLAGALERVRHRGEADRPLTRTWPNSFTTVSEFGRQMWKEILHW